MIIKFHHNSSFVGTTYSMILCDREYILGDFSTDEEEAKDEAVKLLKERFGVEYKREDIEFVWGGRL